MKGVNPERKKQIGHQSMKPVGLATELRVEVDNTNRDALIRVSFWLG